MERKPYPSDVSDDEWSFVAPYLTLMTEEAPQREHDLRWIVRTGAQWRMMPHDLPPWAAVYQQTHRWLKAGVFEAMVNDLRAVLRLAEGRNQDPSVAIFDSRTLPSSPGGVGFRGCWLYGRGGGTSRPGTGDAPGSRQIAPGQARLRLVAAPLGGGEHPITIPLSR
jgi:transposase